MSVVSLQANIDPSYCRLLSGQEAGSLVDTFEARRPSLEERLAAGKALRDAVPRASHARYERPADRPDPVAILEQQNATRVQKLVPVRHARMLVSPFAFLRGSAAVMASDLSRTPLTGLAVATCGDMHVSNGNGASRAWPPAPRSPRDSWEATMPPRRTPRAPACAATASACGATPSGRSPRRVPRATSVRSTSSPSGSKESAASSRTCP